MQARIGDWIQTYSGRQFFPLDPRVEDFALVDIASGLAKECRYAGQCLEFYSVAEHSILMTLEAERLGFSLRDRRAALFHDGSEGIGLRDMARPIKPMLSNYKTIESGIMIKIAAWADFDWPLPAHVKALDERIGLTEEVQIMSEKPAPWRTNFDAVDPLPVSLMLLSPRDAMARFIHEANRLGVYA
jgi:hypothetical protein